MPSYLDLDALRAKYGFLVGDRVVATIWRWNPQGEAGYSEAVVGTVERKFPLGILHVRGDSGELISAVADRTVHHA